MNAATTLPAPPLVKVCACGRGYDGEEWSTLERVGFQDDGAGGMLDLRTCECGSTLALEVPLTPEDLHREIMAAVRRTAARLRSVGRSP